jgi:hypothetical protein
MKKLVFSLMVVACIAFTGCSKDDDDKNKCATCSIDFLGTALVTEACDNGDGTVTLTVNGETQVVSGDELDGVTAAEFVRALEDGCP